MSAIRIPSPRPTARARIEIVPLIDIIFFLLATFVMVSLSMVKNRGIPVNLPAAATGSAQNREDFTSVSITAEGALFLNQDPVTSAQLGERLAQLAAANPELKVFINGDARAEFGTAIAVLDQVRTLGITKIAIETKLRASP